MELLIIILVLLLVAVIAGLGLLLYQTISRRNMAMLQMAQAVRDLVERLPEHEKTENTIETTSKTTEQHGKETL